MSENWAIALVIFVLGQFAIVVTGGIVAFFNLSSRVSDLDKSCEHRITELETKAEKWFVLSATKGLHSPDNHLEADSEIERFVTLYKQHNHDLPNNEGENWQHFESVFTNIVDNDKANPNERALAEGLAELCRHKMMRDRLTPKTT